MDSKTSRSADDKAVEQHGMAFVDPASMPEHLRLPPLSAPSDVRADSLASERLSTLEPVVQHALTLPSPTNVTLSLQQASNPPAFPDPTASPLPSHTMAKTTPYKGVEAIDWAYMKQIFRAPSSSNPPPLREADPNLPENANTPQSPPGPSSASGDSTGAQYGGDDDSEVDVASVPEMQGPVTLKPATYVPPGMTAPVAVMQVPSSKNESATSDDPRATASTPTAARSDFKAVAVKSWKKTATPVSLYASSSSSPAYPPDPSTIAQDWTLPPSWMVDIRSKLAQKSNPAIPLEIQSKLAQMANPPIPPHEQSPASFKRHLEQQRVERRQKIWEEVKGIAANPPYEPIYAPFIPPGVRGALEYNHRKRIESLLYGTEPPTSCVPGYVVRGLVIDLGRDRTLCNPRAEVAPADCGSETLIVKLKVDPNALQALAVSSAPHSVRQSLGMVASRLEMVEDSTGSSTVKNNHTPKQTGKGALPDPRKSKSKSKHTQALTTTLPLESRTPIHKRANTAGKSRYDLRPRGGEGRFHRE